MARPAKKVEAKKSPVKAGSPVKVASPAKSVSPVKEKSPAKTKDTKEKVTKPKVLKH